MSATAIERYALADALCSLWLWAEHPQPALPEGESDSWRRYRDRCAVVGPWPGLERSIRDWLVETAWLRCDGPRHAWPTPRPDELEIIAGDGRWARVRVTVEVLDGLP